MLVYKEKCFFYFEVMLHTMSLIVRKSDTLINWNATYSVYLVYKCGKIFMGNIQLLFF